MVYTGRHDFYVKFINQIIAIQNIYSISCKHFGFSNSTSIHFCFVLDLFHQTWCQIFMFYFAFLFALLYILKVSNSFYHIMEFNWKAIIKWGLRRSWRMWRKMKQSRVLHVMLLQFDVETKWKLKRTETIWWMMKYLISFKNEITIGGGDCQ